MTAATDALEWQDEPGLRTATTTGAELLRHVRMWRPAERNEIVTADHETAAVLLAGTFDLLAGPPAGDRTSWPARGARQTPFAGRPMAVFLPPESAFEARNGTADGEILLFGATQQPTDEAPKEGRAALSQSPLLPLAGSGKSFDPNSGEWMPAETFPTSAESLPPRRMRRRPIGEVEVERVFTSDYKAATLTVDEAVLQPGQQLAIAAIDDRPAHRELVVFCRDEAGDRAHFVRTPDGATDLVLQATAGPLYVAIAYAGK